MTRMAHRCRELEKRSANGHAIKPNKSGQMKTNDAPVKPASAPIGRMTQKNKAPEMHASIESQRRERRMQVIDRVIVRNTALQSGHSENPFNPRCGTSARADNAITAG